MIDTTTALPQRKEVGQWVGQCAREVGQCPCKEGKPLDCGMQCAKCERVRNCRLQFSACRLRFAGCELPYLAYLCPSLARAGRAAQTPVFVGFQGYCPTYPTYLDREVIGIGVVGGRRGCTQGCTYTGVDIDQTGRAGRAPLLCNPRFHRQNYRTRNFLQARECPR